MAESLQRGQRFKLTGVEGLQLEVSLHGSIVREVRSALFVLDRGSIGSMAPSAVVGVRDPHALDGAIRYLGGPHGRFEVGLSALAGRVERVVLVLWVSEAARRTAAHLAQLDEISVTLSDGAGSAVARYALPSAELGRESAVMLGEVYYKSGQWRFRADGSGFMGGLPSMASRFKLPGAIVSHLDGVGPRQGSLPPGPSGGAGPSDPPPSGGPAPTPGAGGLSFPSGHPALPRDWPGGVKPHKIPRSLLPAVARVEVETTDGARHGGTAFAITPGGLLLTCHHVIEGAARVWVTFCKSTVVREARVMVSDAPADLALLALADPWGVEHWLKVHVSPSPPDLGEEVGLIGYPLGNQMGSEVTFSRGIINSVRTPDGLRILQIDAGAAPGSSGGPLFLRETGQVIGVLTSGLAMVAGMHANFAIDVYEMLRLGWLPK